MGVTKTKGFNNQTTNMAEVFKALGHPARLAIMEYLAKTPSCICNDIVDQIPLAQPTISRHLSELKKVGLIQGTIEGKSVYYCINSKVWDSVKDFVAILSNTITEENQCN